MIQDNLLAEHQEGVVGNHTINLAEVLRHFKLWIYFIKAAIVSSLFFPLLILGISNALTELCLNAKQHLLPSLLPPFYRQDGESSSNREKKNRISY